MQGIQRGGGLFEVGGGGGRVVSYTEIVKIEGLLVSYIEYAAPATHNSSGEKKEVKK